MDDKKIDEILKDWYVAAEDNKISRNTVKGMFKSIIEDRAYSKTFARLGGIDSLESINMAKELLAIKIQSVLNNPTEDVQFIVLSKQLFKEPEFEKTTDSEYRETGKKYKKAGEHEKMTVLGISGDKIVKITGKEKNTEIFSEFEIGNEYLISANTWTEPDSPFIGLYVNDSTALKIVKSGTEVDMDKVREKFTSLYRVVEIKNSEDINEHSEKLDIGYDDVMMEGVIKNIASKNGFVYGTLGAVINSPDDLFSKKNTVKEIRFTARYPELPDVIPPGSKVGFIGVLKTNSYQRADATEPEVYPQLSVKEYIIYRKVDIVDDDDDENDVKSLREYFKQKEEQKKESEDKEMSNDDDDEDITNDEIDNDYSEERKMCSDFGMGAFDENGTPTDKGCEICQRETPALFRSCRKMTMG